MWARKACANGGWILGMCALFAALDCFDSQSFQSKAVMTCSLVSTVTLVVQTSDNVLLYRTVPIQQNQFYKR